jgi:hypothetical protein
VTDLPETSGRPHTTERPGSDPAVSVDILATPAPVMRMDRIPVLVKDVWGLRVGAVRPLTSERDANILLGGRYVLKVSNPAAHAARVAPACRCPR